MEVIHSFPNKMKIVCGDIFASECEVIVNTVNCVGVMGKGLALQVKNRYPDVYQQYRQACNEGIVKPGKIFVANTFNIPGFWPKYIFNFPTKRHWKNNSLIEDIELGLNDLLNCINEYEISSIAIPSLGCSNGKLNWAKVKPLIVSSLEIIADDVEILIYEPFI